MVVAKSFCVTVSPRNGCTDSNIEEIVKYCKKQEFSTVYKEKRDDGSAHLHIQLWYTKERNSGDVNKGFIRICERTIEDWDAAQKKFAVMTKCAADDWYLNYLDNVEKKGMIGECLYGNEPDCSDEFYPSEAELDLMKKKKNCSDHKFNNLEDLFYEWSENQDKPVTKGVVAEFLSWAEFDSRKIKVMKDKITRINTCNNLYFYLNKKNNRESYLNKEDLDLECIYDEHLL